MQTMAAIRLRQLKFVKLICSPNLTTKYSFRCIQDEGKIESNSETKILDYNIDDISISKVNALNKVNDKNIELINQISPSLKKSFNLAAYVNSSETLQQLVKLNVDLSQIEKRVDLASHIVKCNFDDDIKPLIMFLLNNGVDIESIGSILTKNPFLLMIPLDDIQVRINYFLFRKFTKEDVASILVRAPRIFNYNTIKIDIKLGNLVKEYNLSSNELRHVINRYPRIIQLNEFQIKKCTFMFLEEMGFNSDNIKSIILQYPILWKKFYDYTGHQDYLKIFDTIHNEMGIPHELIVKSPRIFNRRVSLIKPRHLYLKTLNRAQYDPKKPLYVPLNAFYELNDSEFCLTYAKTSVNDYNEFLKTI